ncbi:hypothetical protein D3C77_727370 [compost metagenome]
MGGEAAMGVVMIMLVVLMGVSNGQGQQGERQGKEQATHGQDSTRAQDVFGYVITTCSAGASALGDGSSAWEHGARH